MFKYIDVHSHLNDKRYDSDIEEVLSRMRDASTASIVVGTDREMSERAIALAEQNDDLWASIGIHPTDQRSESFDEVAYRKMAQHPRVVAIGECGIDYFRMENFEGNKDREADRQQELIEQHMDLAVAADKPLMIHGRPEKGSMDAYEDILYILKSGHQQYGSKVRGNVHFFVGDTNITKQFLDLGFTMSFTGVLTFAHDYDEVIRYIPLDMMHAETDAPYVAPLPYRGRRNEPAFVVETIRKIAELKGLTEIEVSTQLLRNAERMFGLPKFA